MAGKGGKKGRKVGRNARKPSQQRYKSERRWIANKARRIAHHTGVSLRDARLTVLAHEDGIGKAA